MNSQLPQPRCNKYGIEIIKVLSNIKQPATLSEIAQQVKFNHVAHKPQAAEPKKGVTVTGEEDGFQGGQKNGSHIEDTMAKTLKAGSCVQPTPITEAERIWPFKGVR
ncbi:GL18269 [Drosophila persimilis]|uniref:GL18269 n=1 Tax=Drosophila persimilis TaxID=7234 RepID=B4H4P8_DROPE|nr:GL18269 [Drosophila persimilis]